MLKTIQDIQRDGPKYGYHINPDKGTYLLGKCETTEEALSRRAALVLLGLNPHIIHIHPDNFPLPSNASLHYGGKVLGSYVGHEDYIQLQLDQKLTELQVLGEKVKAYPYLQDRYLFLRFCFGRKINYLMRTIPSKLLSRFVSSFDEIRKDIFSSIVNIPTILHKTWVQCRVNIKDSGLGLGFLTEIIPAAYTASMIISLPMLQGMFSSIDLLSTPILQPLYDILPLLEPHIPNVTVQQLLDMPAITHESLQGVLTDHLLKTTIDTLHQPNIDDIQFSTWISSCRNDFNQWHLVRGNSNLSLL
jgi:hypothetical protein